MKLKGYSYFISIGIFLVITLFAYNWFIHSSYFPAFKSWAEDNRILYFITLIIIKIVGIIWPPIPGGIITLGSIPLIGWLWSYAADFIGTILGASLAYILGKHYGYKFLNKILHEKMVEKIKYIKLKNHKEIETTIMLRLLGGGALMEALSYGAGLIGIQYKNFLFGLVITHIVLLPGFYLAQTVTKNDNIFLNIVALLVTIPLILKFKNRYIE